MRKHKSIVAWVLIIAMLFSSNGVFTFADSFDADSLIDDHISTDVVYTTESEIVENDVDVDDVADDVDVDDINVDAIDVDDDDVLISTPSKLESTIKKTQRFGDGTHVHKICGTQGPCTHRTDIIPDTDTHVVISSWGELNDSADLSDTSKGPYFYLTEDKTISIDYPDVLASPRDLFICLNGFSLTLDKGIRAYGKVHITNCGANANVEFAGTTDDSIRTSAEIYGVDNNITCQYEDRLVYISSGDTDESVYLYSVNLEKTSVSSYSDIRANDVGTAVVLERVELSNPVGGGSFIHAGSTDGEYYFVDTTLDFADTERSRDDGGALFHVYENSSITNNVIYFIGNNIIKNLNLNNINLLDVMNQNEFAVNIEDGITTFSDIVMTNPSTGFGPRNFINKTLGYTVLEGAGLSFKNIDMTNDGDTGPISERYLISLGNNDDIEGGFIVDGCKSNDPYGKMVVLESGQNIKFGGDKVYIGNNTNVNDNTDAAGIYVYGNRFAVPIISLYDGNNLHSETYISGIVFPDSSRCSGHIVDNWNSVSGGRDYTDVFTPYHKAHYRDLNVMLKNGNAVIGYDHEHKICGATGSCTHTTNVVAGTDAHTLIDEWEPLYEQSYLTNVAKGPYFYLTEDKTLTFGDSLNRDVYICLNGHSLTYGDNISKAEHKVYITNCGSSANLIDDNFEIKTNTEIYGVNNNINYRYGHYIVNTDGSADQNVYLYDVVFQRTGTATDEDFRIGNSSNNTTLTLEKVNMTNCYKIGNDHTRLYSACSYDGVLNIIDSIFDYSDTARCGPESSYTVESLFQADFDDTNFRRNSINFRGNNEFKNLSMQNLSLFSTQNSYNLPAGLVKGVNNFNINFIDGTTTFKNIHLNGNKVKNFFSNLGEATGGCITINEGATVEIKNITMINSNASLDTHDRYLIALKAEDSILGNLIIIDCVSNGDFARMVYLYSDSINLPRPKIGSGKIQIYNNRDTSNNPAAGIFADNIMHTTGNAELFDVVAGKTINPETKIEGILLYYDSDYKQPVMIVRDWDTVSGGSYCQDLYTENYRYGQDVGVKLVDGHAKVTDVERYTFAFRDKDGNPIAGISDQVVKEGLKLTKVGTPSIPATQEFVGWYRDLDDESTKWNFDDRATQSCTIYAKVRSNLRYTVNYDANGGTGVMDPSTNLKVGEKVTLTTNQYTKLNYTFIGWCADQAKANPDEWKTVDHWDDASSDFIYWTETPNDTKTIYAVWKESHTHKVCGTTGTCTHDTENFAPTRTHTDNKVYFPLDEVSDLYNVSKSQYLYLESDINITSPMTRDIYICLNGYSINATVPLSRVTITNCMTNAEIKTNNVFVNGDAQVYGKNKNISIIASKSFINLDNASDYFAFISDVYLKGNLPNSDDGDVISVSRGTSALDKVYFGSELSSYRSLVRNRNLETIHLIDVTIDSLPAPYNSLFYTGDDAGEIALHGSNMILNVDMGNKNVFNRLDNWMLSVIDGTTTIRNSVFDSPNSGNLVSDNFYVGPTANFSIINNKFRRASGEQAIMLINGAKDIRGGLSILNNQYTYAGAETSTLSVIHATSIGKLRIGSSAIRISGNKVYSDDGTNEHPTQHVYQVLSEIRDGVTPLFEQLAGTTFNASTYISGLAFAYTDAGHGRIINNNSHRECFVADTYNRSNPSTPKDIETGLTDDGNNLIIDAPKIYYDIRYNSNGGTGYMADKTSILTGLTVTLDANNYRRENFIFLGWASTSDATTPDWVDGDTTFTHVALVDDEVYNIYAVWQRILYTLRYDGNGHDGGVVPSIREHVGSGEVIKLDTATPSKTNYKFIGWATSSVATASTYQSGGDFSYVVDPTGYDPTAPEEVVTIYAVWRKIRYTVSYDKNSGMGTDMPVSNGLSGDDLTLSTCSYAKTNYVCIGWDENPTPADPLHPQYLVGNMIMNKSLTADQDGMNIVVYAIWKKCVYTLHYDLQGGTGTIADVPDIESGDTITLSTIKPTKNNSTFLGWSDTPGQTINPRYQPGSTYYAIVDEDGATKDIYAVWNPAYQYTIKFNANGGSGSMADIRATSSVTRMLPSNAFSRTDYTFIGWSENSSSTTATYTNSITETFDTSGITVTLFAIWNYTGGGGGGRVIPSGGGGTSGGGGGGGGAAAPLDRSAMMPRTTSINQVKTIKDVLIAETGEWFYEPLRNEWRFSAKNRSGEIVKANDGFYTISRRINNISSNDLASVRSQTYYFDGSGSMVTGFIRTSDKKVYFMEDQKNEREGNMVYGWKKIGTDWYYFGTDGAMYVDALTPDGYRVSSDGKLIK